MQNLDETDNKTNDTLPRKPERPLESDCCGLGCVPCIFDLYEEEVNIWEKECARLQAGSEESKEGDSEVRDLVMIMGKAFYGYTPSE